MKHSGWVAKKSSLQRQRGFVFKLVHSLLTVAIVVALVVSYKAGYLSFLRHIPLQVKHLVQDGRRSWDNLGNENPDNQTGDNRQTNQSDSIDPIERSNEDSSYTEGSRYAVQVAAGYDSRQLYAWRDALLAEGYDAYLVSLSSARGMTFKLRVGSYNNREDAEAMRDRLRRRYPTNFGGSFVMQGD